jgi:hypothetical protein
MVLIVSGGLVIMLGIAAAIVIGWTRSNTSAATETSARMLAKTVADSVSALTEGGEIDQLETFLASLKERDELGPVHAVRGPVCVADYGEREGAAPEDDADVQALNSGEPVKIVDSAAHRIRYILPMLARESCLGCHASAKQGDVLGADSVTVLTDAADAAQASLVRGTGGVFLGAVLVTATVLALVIARSVIRPVKRIVQVLSEGAAQVDDAGAQIASASEQFANGANTQASSLEQSSAALEQMASVTRTNAENSTHANELARNARHAADRSGEIVNEFDGAMNGISDASRQVGRIVKVIEEIAFQSGGTSRRRSGGNHRSDRQFGAKERGWSEDRVRRSRDTRENRRRRPERVRPDQYLLPGQRGAGPGRGPDYRRDHAD